MNRRIGPGSILGGSYRVVRSIGEGGMGEVFEATHARLAGRYAVKVLHAEVRKHPEFLQRFAREAKVTSSLRHPGIVQVIDFNTTPAGSPYLVMEFLDGEDLGQILAREGRLTLGRTIAITRQIASALAAAHRQDIIHRDLKPQNIFLIPAEDDERERVKVLDFGISKIRFASQKLTGVAVVIGTPQFMAPEQAEGDEEVDAAVDQFSLAAIVYELLAGKPAFTGESLAAVIYRIVHKDPVPLLQLRPELPPAIGPVLARALSKNRSLRFASIAEFSRELRIAARTGEVAAPAAEIDSRPSGATVIEPIRAALADAGKGAVESEGEGDGRSDRDSGGDERPARRSSRSGDTLAYGSEPGEPPPDSSPSAELWLAAAPPHHPPDLAPPRSSGGAAGVARRDTRLTTTFRRATGEIVRLGEFVRSPRARPVVGGASAVVVLVVLVAMLRGGRSSESATRTGSAAASSSQTASPAPGAPATPGRAAPSTGPTIEPLGERAAAPAPAAGAAPQHPPTAHAAPAAPSGAGGAAAAVAGKTGDLAFELASEPTGLLVWIDGKPYPDAETQAHTSVRGALPAGAHRFEVAKEGYEPWRKTVELRADRPNRFLARLDKKADPGDIFQHLTPPPVKPVATQPATTPVANALVPASLSRPGAAAPAARTAALAPPAAPATTPGSCALSIGSLPWTTVWLDGQSTGRHTPVVSLPLPCGKHVLRLKRDDEPIDFTTEIVLLPGTSLKRVFHFDGAGHLAK